MLEKMELRLLAKKVGVKPAEVRIFLHLLEKKGPLKNKRFLQQMDLPQSVLRDLKKKLAPYLSPSSNQTALNAEGKILAQKMTFPKIDWLKIKTKIAQHQKNRPAPKRQLDQLPADLETVIKRTQLMVKEGDLENRDVFFLGDTDLTSLAAAATNLARTIQVADIDPRLLNFVETVAKKEKLIIKTIKYDARQPLLPHLHQRFDTIFTDPPYTLNGVSLFLSRAIDALSPSPTSMLYFCYGTSRRSLERALKIQEVLTQMKLALRLKLPDFNHYHGAESIGSKSDLFLGQITPQTKPLLTNTFSGQIYTHQNS